MSRRCVPRYVLPGGGALSRNFGLSERVNLGTEFHHRNFLPVCL